MSPRPGRAEEEDFSVPKPSLLLEALPLGLHGRLAALFCTLWLAPQPAAPGDSSLSAPSTPRGGTRSLPTVPRARAFARL